MDFHSLNIDLCTILDALEDPIHIIDTDGILVFANLAWEKLIGLPRESAVGLYINDAISRGTRASTSPLKRMRTAGPPSSPTLTRSCLTPSL
ncbi:PAS domain-containing protein [Flavonifractor plautii]|nr:PAS domain-containing protein [Flavonifractor plautii]